MFAKLAIGDLELRHPIIQGGMGVAVSRSGLAGAVSRAGGLGVIASIGLGVDTEHRSISEAEAGRALAHEIRAVKSQGLPVGVNVMAASVSYATYVATAVAEGADVLFSGAGLPLRLPQTVGDAPIRLVPIISSPRALEAVCRHWWRSQRRVPDAVVVEGPLAGGHLGFHMEELLDGTAPDLETLVVRVRCALERYEDLAGRRISLIAAGGVYTGHDIARFLALGADGVQMGTRFVATHECDAALALKQAYVDCGPEDVAIVLSPVGMPARVVLTPYLRRLGAAGERIVCRHACLHRCDADKAGYCIAKALVNAASGNLEEGFPMCGANAYRIKRIVSVQALFDELLAELRDASPARDPVQLAQGPVGSSSANRP
jgi:nitronate monooxygenase